MQKGQKGQKAIRPLMPVSVKRRGKKGAAPGIVAGSDDDQGATFNLFRLRANWFLLDQTEGADFEPEMIVRSWDAATALVTLDVTEVPFEQLRDNLPGHTRGRSIAISALNPFKHKTRLHELVHLVLRHTAQGDITDRDVTPHAIREAQTEGIAYILCTLLDLSGQGDGRDYPRVGSTGANCPRRAGSASSARLTRS